MRLLISTLIVTLFTSTMMVAQKPDRASLIAAATSIAHDEPLKQKFRAYQALQLNAQEAFDQVSAVGFRNEMDWSVGNKKFRLFLLPHDVRHPDYALEIVTAEGTQQLNPGPSYTYRGWNLDDPSKEVRLSISPGYVSGFITDTDGTEWYFQPALDFGIPGNAATIMYRHQDVIQGEVPSCATTHEMDLGGNHSGDQSNQHSRSAACKEVEVAIAADYSMYVKYNNNAQALAQHLLDVKNAMEPNYAIYDVEFKVVKTVIETTSGQLGWSTSTDPGELLDSYCCWAGSGSSAQLDCTGQNGFGVTHDVGELWTNRDFTSSTVGIAWLGTICNSMFRYSANQHYTTDLQSLRVLIAHESGHNFGANHDAAGTAFIMAPAVNPSVTSWSSTSQTAINANLPNFACLGACGAGGGGNCASTLTVTSSTATGTKEASSSISTSGSINLNASAMYNAPTVQLNSAFTVPNGITFEIRSNGCNP